MSNHFHLLIKQNLDRSIENFMRSLLTRYSGYFNKRNERVGSLFQGPYKAVLIDSDEYLLHLSRYIHLNPQGSVNSWFGAPSSYPDYLRERKTSWVKTDLILSFFDQAREPFIRGHATYRNFVEDEKLNIPIVLNNMIIE